MKFLLLILLINFIGHELKANNFLDFCRDKLSVPYLPENLSVYKNDEAQEPIIEAINQKLINTTFRRKIGIIKEVLKQVDKSRKILKEEAENVFSVDEYLFLINAWRINKLSREVQKLINPYFILGELDFEHFNDLSPSLSFPLGLTNNQFETFDGAKSNRLDYTFHDVLHMKAQLSGRDYLFYKNIFSSNNDEFIQTNNRKKRRKNEVVALIKGHEIIYEKVKDHFIKLKKMHVFNLSWFYLTHEENHKMKATLERKVLGPIKNKTLNFSLSLPLWLKDSWKHERTNEILFQISKRIKARSTKGDLGENSYSVDTIYQNLKEIKKLMSVTGLELDEIYAITH